MTKLRQRLKKKDTIDNKSAETKEIREVIHSSKEKMYTPINTDIIVSTGCTLLDLEISGGRLRGGGLPGGIMMEIFGPSGSGKTALVTELSASVQYKGGESKIDDPESRFDKEYAKIYGCKMSKDNYRTSNSVNEVFAALKKWIPKNKNVINLFAVDSIAALCSDQELTEDGDKRGQAKAKELTQGCRKTCITIAENNKIVLFTNHEKDGEYGKITPGGKAVPYHSSLRLRIAGKKPITMIKTFKSIVRGKEMEKKIESTIGIKSEVTIKKSSIDKEYRTCPLYIIFGKGIDDVRGNLQYIKDMTKDTVYDVFDKTYKSLAFAVRYIEEHDLETKLREHVIDTWEQIETLFETENKKKVRF